MLNAFFVLARMDSSRLPGKAFLKLGNTTLLGSIINRLGNIGDFKVVVLTTDRETDDRIAGFAQDNDCLVFRGDPEDVSDRIVSAIREFNVSLFFRINGDSPCLDITLIENAISRYNASPCDFVSNLVRRTWPYGVAIELFNSKCYVETQQYFASPEEKEHPTSYFYQHINDFNYLELQNETDWSRHSLTVDTPDDYIFLLTLLEKYPEFLNTGTAEKIRLLEEFAHD